MGFQNQVVYGQDGLSAYDGAGVRRIWLDPATTSLSFYDAVSVRRIWLDGIGMLFSFFDAAGMPRCEIGQLPARGVSPAHFGFRVSDATGAPLYDSQGLIAVATIVGNTAFSTTPISTANGGTYAVIGGSVMTFSIPRQAQAVVTANIVGKTDPASSSGFSYTQIFVDGVAQTQSAALWEKGVGYTTSPHVAPLLLTAGSHTIDVRAATDNNTTTFDIWNGAAITVVYGK